MFSRVRPGFGPGSGTGVLGVQGVQRVQVLSTCSVCSEVSSQFSRFNRVGQAVQGVQETDQRIFMHETKMIYEKRTRKGCDKEYKKVRKRIFIGDS